ncbi:hypothetical protein LSAT2_008760 [Lamellibrachia satsuma]|nr:hypothetical protein LSAT2_008760 [Lamellibrachia satsuma]
MKWVRSWVKTKRVSPGPAGDVTSDMGQTTIIKDTYRCEPSDVNINPGPPYTTISLIASSVGTSNVQALYLIIFLRVGESNFEQRCCSRELTKEHWSSQ